MDKHIDKNMHKNMDKVLDNNESSNEDDIQIINKNLKKYIYYNFNEINIDSIKIEENDNIEKNIKKLPEELKKYIYHEFIETELFYQEFKNVIESKESQSLNASFIYKYIPIILSKPKYIKYLCKKMPFIQIIYRDHKIRNNKSFRLMTKGQSFAQCILMYLYH